MLLHHSFETVNQMKYIKSIKSDVNQMKYIKSIQSDVAEFQSWKLTTYSVQLYFSWPQILGWKLKFDSLQYFNFMLTGNRKMEVNSW